MLGKTALLCGCAVVLAGCVVTPEPLSLEDMERARDVRMATYQASQEGLDDGVTLYDAIARAIKYNLDHKVEMMEEALKARELRLARYDLLPEIAASYGVASRNNFSGASSSELLGDRTVGDQSLVSSTSSERDVFTSNLTFSYDILDFGLSYIRAKQKADEALIATERRRKVVNRIVEDVRTAYWRAVSAERLSARLGALEADIEDALRTSMKAYERRNVPPLSALTYQRELLKIQEEIQNLLRELSVAKTQLAALMNVDPGVEFDLVMPDRDRTSLVFEAKPEAMIEAALVNRPELREISYRQRINRKEAKAALLDLLPSLRAFGGFDYDSNDFLFNNHWAGWGARASWNLIEAFRLPARRKTVEAQQDLLDARALALTMAVITQVHVSKARFDIEKERVETMRKHFDVQENILGQVGAGYDANRISRQTYIREQMNQIVADAKYDIALADLQNSFANIHAAMGLDPFGVDVTGEESLAELSDKIREHWRAQGDRLAFAPLDDVAGAALAMAE